MKKGIISALITIFLIDKSSKGMDEKTERSSWFRTSVYFILTIIFVVFFYRSFQVRAIINGVEISSLRGHEDSLHNSLDTIEVVYIFNDFKPLGSYKNPLVDYSKKNSSYLEGGGVQIIFQEPSTEGIIKNKDSLTDEKIKEIETLTRIPIKPYTGSIYSAGFFSMSTPSFIPIYPKMKADGPSVKHHPSFSTIEYVGNLNNNNDFKRRILVSKQDPAEGAFVDNLFYKRTVINHDSSVPIKPIILQHSLVNKLNVFSACDLSQYTYLLILSSDIYIKHLKVVYDVPIEMCGPEGALQDGVNSFAIKDSTFLSSLSELSLCSHVKLPTMANLQQIRSLVLTAIVSALFSLFCTNLFFRVRKMVMNKMLKRQIIISEWVEQYSNNLKDFKFLLFTIILVFLLLILMYVCLGAMGHIFLIGNGKTAWTPILNVFLLVTIISGCIYIMIYKSDDVINYVETLILKIKSAKKKEIPTSKIKGAKKEKTKRTKK